MVVPIVREVTGWEYLEVSWFSSRQGTEEMKRRTVKDIPAMLTIEDLPFVHSWYSVGFLEKNKSPNFHAPQTGLC